MDEAAQRWLEREEDREELLAEVLYYLTPVIAEEIKRAVGEHERSFHPPTTVVRRLYAVSPITESQLRSWPDSTRERLRELHAQRVKRFDPLERVEEPPAYQRDEDVLYDPSDPAAGC